MPTSASHLNYNFTYKIESIDIERCSVVVTYTPEDVDLLPYTLNVGIGMLSIGHFVHEANNELIYQSDADIPFQERIKKSITIVAPVEMWKVQKGMVQEITFLNSLKV